jgi:hypothetical protein
MLMLQEIIRGSCRLLQYQYRDTELISVTFVLLGFIYPQKCKYSTKMQIT